MTSITPRGFSPGLSEYSEETLPGTPGGPDTPHQRRSMDKMMQFFHTSGDNDSERHSEGGKRPPKLYELGNLSAENSLFDAPWKNKTADFVGITYSSMLFLMFCNWHVICVLLTILGWWINTRWSYWMVGLYFASSMVPQLPHSWRRSWYYKCMAYYFRTVVYSEHPLEKYNNHPKPILFLAVPHGVVPYAEISSMAMVQFRHRKVAAATYVKYAPLLQTILSAFAICDASWKSLTRSLKKEKTDVVLYPGGVAEIYASKVDNEIVYFQKRKGCVKLAMNAGADICVIYGFGNTQSYKQYCPLWIERLTRTYSPCPLMSLWGRFGTIIPYITNMVDVYGKILPMPDMRDKIIPSELLVEQHAKVTDEIQEIFERYKHLHPVYKSRKLSII